EVDHRADLFSLGCVLYFMLTGKFPFSGSSTMAVLTALAVREPKPLAEAAPGTPAPLMDLVKRLLAKDPAKRPSSARDVAAAPAGMEATAATEIIHSPPGSYPPPSTAAPPQRPHRWLPFAAAGAAAFVMLLMGALGLWHIFNGETAQQGQPTGPVVPTGEPIVVGIL